MINKDMLLRIASLGYVGYFPGSGTIASLCVIPYIFFMHYMQISLVIQAIFIIFFMILSFFIIQKVVTFLTNDDPSEIVLDECVGMMIAAYALPFSWLSLFLAFFLFRLLDISKFFGVSLFERLPGAWGILLDDIAAACVANLILRFIFPLACQ